MVLIIHGNGLVAISQKISEVKKRFDPLSVNEISGKNSNFDQIIIDLSSSQLFSEKRLFVLEDFDEKAIDLAKLPDDEDLLVVLRFNKQLPTTNKLLKEAEKKNIKIITLSENEETSIFPFLDLLSEKNPRALGQVDQIIEQWSGQYLLTMIFYNFRRMIQTPKKLPPFVIKKLEKQKINFPQEKLNNLYGETLETDFKIKTGLLDEKMGLIMLVQKIIS